MALAVVLAVVAGGVVWLWASGPDSDDTSYRQADTIATAVAWPRQSSAAGLTRAVLATNLGKSGGVIVVESTELYGDTPDDPMARLVLRFDRPAEQNVFFPDEAVTACYELVFNVYGAMGPPDLIHCPDADAVTPPAVPAFGEQAFDARLERVLSALPDSPTENEVVDRLKRADLLIVRPMRDDVPERAPEDPVVGFAVAGEDVATSFYRAMPGTPVVCLLGSRVDGQLAVWRPAEAKYHKETACTAAAAMAREGLR